jgi:hypothetical protein
MLDPAIWNDKETIRLSPEGFILFIGLISQADDEGIVEIDPESLHWRLGRKELSEERIAELLPEINNKGLIEIYGDYAFLPNWFKHQALNRPNETKLRRPPAELLQKHPSYIEGWENAFSSKDKPAKYPFGTMQIQLSEDSLNDHGALSEPSMPMERKGKEEKGKERNIYVAAGGISESSKSHNPPSSPARPAKKHPRSVYHLIENAFLSKNQDFDYSREGPHMVKLEKKALARPDPEAFIKKTIVVFWDLTHSNDRLFKDQPFLPSILDSGGMWPRVMKRMEQLDARNEELTPDLQDIVDHLFVGQAR